MKTIYTLLLFLTIALFSNTLNAQNVKRPLKDKIVAEEIPESPGENWSWVKAHWEWNGVKYTWKPGHYIEKKLGSIWVDGEWERDQRSGWWVYNTGYWQKETAKVNVKTDENTAEADKASKEKRQQNKSGGLFIKTGS